ncbi:MAG: hypothetical protein ACREHF_04555 [Rhizomicrobium sp.]
MTSLSPDALIAAVSAISGAIVAGLFSYLGVRQTIRAQRRIEDDRRREELAAIRLALYSEIGTIAQQCLLECRSRTLNRSHVVGPAHSARLPPLRIYDAVAEKIGQLSRAEIITVIGFAGCLWDVGVLVEATFSEAPPIPDTITQVLSNTCNQAADCLTAIPVPDSEKDQGFIAALREAGKQCEKLRTAARESLGLRSQGSAG